MRNMYNSKWRCFESLTRLPNSLGWHGKRQKQSQKNSQVKIRDAKTNSQRPRVFAADGWWWDRSQSITDLPMIDVQCQCVWEACENVGCICREIPFNGSRGTKIQSQKRAYGFSTLWIGAAKPVFRRWSPCFGRLPSWSCHLVNTISDKCLCKRKFDFALRPIIFLNFAQNAYVSTTDVNERWYLPKFSSKSCAVQSFSLKPSICIQWLMCEGSWRILRFFRSAWIDA